MKLPDIDQIQNQNYKEKEERKDQKEDIIGKKYIKYR